MRVFPVSFPKLHNRLAKIKLQIDPSHYSDPKINQYNSPVNGLSLIHRDVILVW